MPRRIPSPKPPPHICTNDGEFAAAVWMAATSGAADKIARLRKTYPQFCPCTALHDSEVGDRLVLDAALHHDTRTLAELLACGANPNPSSRINGQTALIRALKATSTTAETTRTVALLLQAGAEVNAKDGFGNTPLVLAAALPKYQLDDDNRPQGLKECAAIFDLLIEAKAAVNTRNTSGITALHEACTFHAVAQVTRLLENGADPNLLDNEHVPPLVRAFSRWTCADDVLAIVKMLLEKGANPLIRTRTGLTAFDNLCQYRSLSPAQKEPYLKLLVPAMFDPRWWQDNPPEEAARLWHSLPPEAKAVGQHAISTLNRTFKNRNAPQRPAAVRHPGNLRQ